ncbi:Ig-like domain-containing protein [Arthrobacter sp. G.S.26]|uniref:Ig-like domain-containing protein n=1 Tax=Arthrobacter sp. G.S.26 TaxID=3433706 RepID=UPI003D7728EA
MKLRRWGIGAIVAVVLSGGLAAGPASAVVPPITPGHLPYPAGGTSVMGQGTDSGNRNAQLAETVPAQITKSWKAIPPFCPSSGGSASISISVSGNRTVVVDTQHQCSWLSAYETVSGKLLWRHAFHFSAQAKIVGSKVYFAHDNMQTSSPETLDAYDISTGKLLWSSESGGKDQVVVGSGLAMSSLYGLDATTGSLKLVFDQGASTNSSLLIDGGKILHNAHEAVSAFSVTTGKLLWRYAKSLAPFTPGEGMSPISVHNGRLYVPSVRSETKTLVLDVATGKFVRTLPNSEISIAFDGRTGIFTSSEQDKPAAVSAVDLETGTVQWTHRLGMQDLNYGYDVLSSAPVIANGLVWILAGSDTFTEGQLIALDEVTGLVRSGTAVGCAPAMGGNLAIAQHRIIVPTNCGVQSFVPGPPDKVAPVAETRTPAPIAPSVDQAADVTVGFNEAVRGVNGATFTLRNPAGTRVPAAVSYNETTRVATLNPGADLAPDAKYTVELTGSASGIRDTSGNVLATTKWTFTTGPAPTVTTTSPALLETGMGLTQNVTATMSEPVTGVNATTFTLKNPAGTLIPAAVTYNATTRVATLNPTSSLRADTVYTATLFGQAIRDGAGNPLTDYTHVNQPGLTRIWTFTTGPNPRIIAKTPASNATGVGRSAPVTVTFSEPVIATGVGNTIMLRNSTTGAMIPTARFDYDAATRTATMYPRVVMPANTRFTVTISNPIGVSIRDLADNPLIGPITWSFTTGP